MLDGTGSDVGIDYIVTIDKSSEPDTPDLPDDLVFQVDGTDYSLGNEIEGKIEHAAGRRCYEKDHYRQLEMGLWQRRYRRSR